MTMESDPTPNPAEIHTVEQVGRPDIESIIDFMKPVYIDTYPNDRGITAEMFERPAFRPYLKYHLGERLKNPSAFLLAVRKEGEIVGTLGTQFDKDNPSTTEIWGFYVAPNWQGKGVSGTLWQNLMQHERTTGVKKYHLIVAKDSARAIAFYTNKTNGFKIVGEEEWKWPRWIDERIMNQWWQMEKEV